MSQRNLDLLQDVEYWKGMTAECRANVADLRRQLEEANHTIGALKPLRRWLATYTQHQRQLTDLQAAVERQGREWDEVHVLLEAERAQVERLREAAKQIVDALDDTCRRGYCIVDDGEGVHEAVDILRTAPAQPTKEGGNA